VIRVSKVLMIGVPCVSLECRLSKEYARFALNSTRAVEEDSKTGFRSIDFSRSRSEATPRVLKISRTGQILLTIHGSQSNFPERDNGMTKIMDSTQLGRLVRERRKQASLTLKDAAGMAGVGVRFLSELERGKPTVRIGLALQVLQLFGLELHVHARGESP
jgi:HTH-type transcriptional regulator/antitoxin HipB